MRQQYGTPELGRISHPVMSRDGSPHVQVGEEEATPLTTSTRVPCLKCTCSLSRQWANVSALAVQSQVTTCILIIVWLSLRHTHLLILKCHFGRSENDWAVPDLGQLCSTTLLQLVRCAPNIYSHNVLGPRKIKYYMACGLGLS